MKKTDLPSKIRCLSLIGLALIIMVGCHVYHNYYTYNSIKVVVKENASIAYGSANYNLSDLIKKVDGEIVSVKNDIDTTVVGEQEVVVEVKKDNVIKDVPLVLNVVDTVAPVINLKEDVVYITEGDGYDVASNVESVIDEVDGNIPYNDNVDENTVFYYDFGYYDDISTVGEHEIIVHAKDKTGNYANRSYTLVVEEKVYYTPVYANAASSPYGNDVVGIAYSLVGAPYVGGGNSPYGFDCSGFVQYVYSRVGVGVTRSTWSQMYDGVGVSYQNAEPGDILVWGYAGGYATHSALYVGNGTMIHAANPGTGVIISSVDFWLSGSGTTILSVRRVS